MPDESSLHIKPHFIELRHFSTLGLKLLLNVESYMYQTGINDFSPVETVGAVIKVHHPYVAPLPQEASTFISPATLSRLAVKKVHDIL